MNSFFVQVRRSLHNMYSRHLLTTNIITCGGLLGVGDCLVQQIGFLHNKEARYDYARTARLTIVGFGLGPFNHYWYSFLDKVIKGYGMKVVGKKIICDQFVAGPFFCTMFLAGTTLLEGGGVSGAIAEWKDKFLSIYIVDWVFWPAAQFINFRFLPTRFRVLYVSFATLVWNSFLSYMKHRTIDEEETVHQKFDNMQKEDKS